MVAEPAYALDDAAVAIGAEDARYFGTLEGGFTPNARTGTRAAAFGRTAPTTTKPLMAPTPSFACSGHKPPASFGMRKRNFGSVI